MDSDGGGGRPKTGHEFCERWLEDARDHMCGAEAALEAARLYALTCDCHPKLGRQITTLTTNVGMVRKCIGQVLLNVTPSWRRGCDRGR